MSDYLKESEVTFAPNVEFGVEEPIVEDVEVTEEPSNYDHAVSALRQIAERAPATGAVHPQLTKVGDIARATLRHIGE